MSHHEEVGPLQWAGVVLTALVVLDHNVVNERIASGLGAVTSYSTVDVLSTLPRGLEVPWSELHPVHRERLAALDRRVLATSPTGATALLAPPCEPLVLQCRARDWRHVSVVAPLVQYAPVTLVLSRRPRDADVACEAARRYGVGLSVSRQVGECVSMAPAVRRVRLSAGRTRFLEVLFASWLRGQSVHPGSDESEPGLQLL